MDETGTRAVSLLERAIAYALGALLLVTRGDLYRRTPCGGWDVADLLAHLDDSVTALHEAADLGRVGLVTGTVPALAASMGRCGGEDPALAASMGRCGGEDPALVAGAGRCGGDPVLVVRDRAATMLGAWAGTLREQRVRIGGCSLPAATVAQAGAVEVAVHAWDLARACGRPRPVPPALAADLLDVAATLVADEDRPDRFAAPVAVPPRSAPEDRLIAYLGRDPAWATRSRPAG
ncbi:maleylpyruvate isomerase family mycothiol-dependent enzyme [Nonomuraea sp. NPDC047897]|uniref:maleylpyruvate isomerase family mycothiol-dependent enzyme n=1 Tax=Nonomuraea sp. NPDC047897 TaxID=3364346 RepID=UPI003711D65B